MKGGHPRRIRLLILHDHSCYHSHFFLLSFFIVPGFVTSQVEGLSEAIGFDMETLSYTLGMILCYPLGIIMASLPYGKIKHAFSFLLGAFLLQFTIGKQWIHHLLAVVISYVLLLILPPKLSKTIVPTFIMMYVTLGHLHRQYINYLGWDLDFTGSHMVLSMKLYSLAYNLYDGDLLKKGKPDRATKKCEHLAVMQVPGILEFLGYTFNFSTILAGLTSDDVDGDTLGMAVIGAAGNGTWQFSTDSTDGNDGAWTDFGSLDTDTALLLANSSWVRYSPDNIAGETVGISFHTWDGTSGTASTAGSSSGEDGVLPSPPVSWELSTPISV